MRIVAVLIAFALIWAADAQAQNQPPAPPWDAAIARKAPLAGKIFDRRGGQTLTPEALIERLAMADFVLLGERHDNPDHHRLQAWIVQRLLERGRAYAVAFEMIDSSQATKLAAFLAASPRDAEGIGEALNWRNSGWPAWWHYQPIAAAALNRGQPILAANLPPDLARTIARQGLSALSADMVAELRLTPNEDAAILASHRAEIQKAHCGILPEPSLAPFAAAQYVRDGKMARVMIDHRRASGGQSGAILIAGTGHVRSDIGVPRHLARHAPEARALSLAFIEADDKLVGPADDATRPYDLLWFTARVDAVDTDHCAAMRAPR